MNPIEVVGVRNFVSGLLRVRRNIGHGVERGFVKSALFLMRESYKIVPVQLGNLKGSGDIRKHGSGLKTEVVFGYFGTAYGAYVHEIPNPPHAHGKEFNIKHAAEIAAAKGTWRGTAAGGMFNRKPNEQWKFLERPIREHTNDVLVIIKNEVMKLK